MRDLYSRLGIDQSANDREIRNAISVCGNAMVSDSAKEVLLISRRRQNYDRVHAVLTDIGALRAQLGLNHGDNWRSPESDDFTRNSVGVCSEYDSLLAKIDQVKEREKARSSKESKKSRLLATFWFAAVPLGLVGLFWLSNSMSVQSVSPLPVNTEGVHTSDGTTDRPSSTVPTESAFNAPELPLPANGTIRWHISMIGVAPLEIRTSSGSNYLVKLERVTDGQDVLDIFIRGESNISVNVPLGEYQLEYAVGQKWYGDEQKFGPETSYNRADFDIQLPPGQLRRKWVYSYTIPGGKWESPNHRDSS